MFLDALKGLNEKYKGNCTAKHMQALVKGLENQCISVAEVAAAAGHNWGCVAEYLNVK